MVSPGDNLQEMSNTIIWEKSEQTFQNVVRLEKSEKNIINLSSAEFTHSVRC